MDYSFLNDLNNAPQNQGFSLIPTGSNLKASVCIKPGGHGPEGWFTQSKSSQSVYLNMDFTIIDREYSGRIIHQMIGIQGTKRNEKGEDVWGLMGRATLRAIIESAYGILPKDESPQAQQKRMLQDISSINGLICVVKVGIDVDPTGEHPDRNKITGIITPDMAIYRKLMVQDASQTVSPSNLPEWLNR